MQARISRFFFVAVLSLGLSGCNQPAPPRPALLQEGRIAFERQDYRRAEERLTQFLKETRDPSATADALYIRGMSRAKLERRAEAYGDLRQAVARAGDVEVKWRANLMLGTLYYEDGNWAAAAQALISATANMPAVPPQDTALYRLGLCHERLGRWTEARYAYQKIVNQFSSGKLAQDARRRLDANANAYSIQCGAFGKPENANSRAADLQRKGFAASVRRETRGGGALHVVYVGRYANYDEAQRQLGLVRQHVPDAVLWP